jgi:DNA-binding NtrC family response regulator
MEIASFLRAPVPPALGGPLPDLRTRRMSAVPAYGPMTPSAQSFGRVVASSAAMTDVFVVLRRLARTDVTMTLIGETGTGKDVTAHAVHEASTRSAAPFVVFDCGAVPPNLVESELFGHERGAFTGAHAEHEGAFERARGGTLFLDEIGELPLDLQPRLLRALDSHAIRRVGGTRDRRVDVRIVAATNRDLAALVEAKQFRQDLYFRLAAAVVNLPPLRDRLEDLSILVPQLLADLGRGHVRASDAAYEVLGAHRWPGNVRELKNVLAYALAFVDAGVLDANVLRFAPAAGQGSPLDRLPLGGQSLSMLEQVAIRQTLSLTRGNKVQAARLLGIASSTLYEKLKRYGL